MNRSSNSGQAALILIMIMAVVGAISVGLASQSVENLRSQEIENTSSQSFRAAEAALEVALNQKADVPSTPLAGVGNYSATYATEGTDGFVADDVAEGDVVQTTLVGAAGVTELDVFWNSPSAVKVTVLSGDKTTGYAVKYYTADPDATRILTSKFTASTTGSYTFKSINFNNKLVIPINLGASPAPKLVRINVLYQKSKVAVQPVGGTLASQRVSVKAVGTASNNVVTNLIFSRDSQRVPVIFENVLYTNSSLAQ